MRRLKAKTGMDAGALYQKARGMINGGDFAAAEILLRQSIDAGPTAAALHDLAVIYYMRNDRAQAKKYFERAIEHDPEYHQAYSSLGNIAFEAQDIAAAVDNFWQALKIRPDNREYQTAFIAVIRSIDVLGESLALRDAIAQSLQWKDIRITELSSLWISVLKHDAIFPPLLALAKDSDEETFMAALDTQAAAIAADSFFLSGLRRLVIPDLEFEHFLVRLRRWLLTRSALEAPADITAIASALACYCFSTQYIFETSATEAAAVQALLGDGRQNDTRGLAAICCYLPLTQLEDGFALAKHFTAGPLADYMNEFILPAFERQDIKAAISVVTPIDDAVSLRVREQYEDFPYPQWRGIMTSVKDEAMEGHLRTPGTRILNAGCGTGQESIDLACVFPAAEILAVDLSRSSLSYGIQQARRYGLENIEFRQGDILQLPSLGRQFDFIASSGVLHHMADPQAGLNVLASMLKSDGIMRIGLYSRTARRHLTKAQNIIKENGYPRDLEGIRAFRRDANLLMEPVDFAGILRLSDYYKTDECRDLLFHVQEHQVDIPEIDAMCAEAGLEFLQFEIAEQIQTLFFEEQRAATNDLHAWHRFEHAHPDLFIGMYKFWAKKVA